MADDLYLLDDILKELRKKGRVRRLVFARRSQEYEAMLNSGGPIVVARVVRELYPRSGDVNDLYSGSQLYSSAFEILIDKVVEMQGCSKIEAGQLIIANLIER